MVGHLASRFISPQQMKTLAALAAALLLLPCVSAAGDEKKKERVSLDGILFDESVWTKAMQEIKGPEEELSDADLKRVEKAKEKGITLKFREEGFSWLSGAKEGLRAAPGEFQLLGEEVGEVVVRGREGKPVEATISIYNRGDDGEISSSDYEKKMTAWKSKLDGKLDVRAETRNQQGAVQVQGWTWRKGDTGVALEGSVNRSEKRVEFIRLRMLSLSAAKDEPRRMARRGSFAQNVKKDSNGFTWIEGIPMVDQGQKGYCVVASIERVTRYFGADMDQHEMAQIANTGEHGTRGDEMEKAFQRVTGKVHLRTLKHIEFDMRQMEKDIRGYNRVAKKQKVKTFDFDPDEYIIDPREFWFSVNKEAFREMKRSQTGHDHFKRKIKEYVDQGIPLCWTLYLGMFPEKGLPQTSGGHMRLIIGYNFDSPDDAEHKIYYTDSWGEGHEKKTMRADEAYCMTMAMYSMVPNK